MKRFREGFKWNSNAGMIGIIGQEGLEIVPFDFESGQLMFRFMVEY